MMIWLNRTIIGGLAFLIVLFARSQPARASDPNDTVYIVGGGRVRGLIMVEDPKVVVVQLPDGSSRSIDRDDVKRVVYGSTTSGRDVGNDDTDEPPPPPRRRRHRVTTMDDYQGTTTPSPPKTEMRSEGMVVAGVIMTFLGSCSMIGGLIDAKVQQGGGHNQAAGWGLFAAGGGVALTGAILLGVGARQVPVKDDERKPAEEAWTLRPSVGGLSLDF